MVRLQKSFVNKKLTSTTIGFAFRDKCDVRHRMKKEKEKKETKNNLSHLVAPQ